MITAAYVNTSSINTTETCITHFQTERASTQPLKRLLAVGPSIPKILYKQEKHIIVHHPLIALRSLIIPNEQRIALSLAEHLIITSKHALSFLVQTLQEINLTAKSQYLYCIGTASAQAARDQFPEAFLKIASHEQQEGIVDMIIEDRPKSIAWPRSKQARPFLANKLHEEGIELIDIPIYEPFETKDPPDLENIDEVFFSSPSSVHAFFALYTIEKTSHLMFSAIGQITKKQLQQKGIPYVRIYSSSSSISHG